MCLCGLFALVYLKLDWTFPGLCLFSFTSTNSDWELPLRADRDHGCNQSSSGTVAVVFWGCLVQNSGCLAQLISALWTSDGWKHKSEIQNISSAAREESERIRLCSIRSFSSLISSGLFCSSHHHHPHKLCEYWSLEYWFLTTEAFKHSNRHPSLPSEAANEQSCSAQL